MLHSLRAVAAITLIVFVASASADVLSDWNLLVRNDLTSTSEVDGSALIGGNLSGTSNYAVHGATASSGDGLAVVATSSPAPFRSTMAVTSAWPAPCNPVLPFS